MASIVSFNGDFSIMQPSTLKEERMRKVHDSTSVNGVIRRSWYADKWQVTLTFSGVSIPQYNVIAQYIYNQANPVTYYNSVTGTTFTGFVTAGIDTFIPGNSWLKNLSITLQEF
jgi:hypothetical protein